MHGTIATESRPRPKVACNQLFSTSDLRATFACTSERTGVTFDFLTAVDLKPTRVKLSPRSKAAHPDQGASMPGFQPEDRLSGQSSSDGRQTKAAPRGGSRSGVPPSFLVHTDSPSSVTRFCMRGTIAIESRRRPENCMLDRELLGNFLP
ncbi:putative disease resistance protein-like [Dorcoceras hygrometricum]|uniref:Putative disease resistance protein-like n=1 Tax=Dorcoceras hygrometricum TaxID=472368 RepID=A0A2Z7DIH4_9LAMI|nr:putative disease resistance protein-like [Dorcoceras hygrometricum]